MKLTRAWNTCPEYCVELPSSVENIAKSASKTSCRNLTISAPSNFVILSKVSPIQLGTDFHRKSDNKSTVKTK